MLDHDFHVTRIELRQLFQKYMDERCWKRKDFAQATGIEAVTISNILNNKQSIMLHQLDAIARAFQLPPGYFYPYFFAECCSDEGRIRPSKLGEFVSTCILMNRMDLADQGLAFLIEDKNKNRTFDTMLAIGEKLFHANKGEYALPFFDMIVQEEDRRTERLAIAYFRKFLIVRERDLYGAGYEALYRLTEYLTYLPEQYTSKDQKGIEITCNLKLEAYFRMLTFYNVVEDWAKLAKYAKELHELARLRNDSRYQAESLLYQSSAYIGKGEFEKALEVTKQYAPFGEYYSRLSAMNQALILTEMGQIEEIDQVLQQIESKEELWVYLPAALEAYMKKNRQDQVAELLTRYQTEVDELSRRKDWLSVKRFLRLLTVRAEYYFQMGEIDIGLSDIIEALEKACTFKNVQRIKQCAYLFYTHSQHAGVELKERFRDLMMSAITPEIFESST
ncbi:helix-turn-helix domain-containing protein [Brevibacillus dissolubilis]|uniref:helix-turn-helix domain-containing protein n=1 Tax=Brevibacillus dissolubilis TaxID=1844116 RepID=UPI0011163E4D|nr:helix-turn-helix transcriptional regulator [Brevibacillus dissolubilis]